MRSTVDDGDRHIVPRWRESKRATNAPELWPLRPRGSASTWQSDIEEKAAEFRHSPTVGVAADLANSAMFEGRKDLVELAAVTLLQEGSTAPEFLQRELREALESPSRLPSQSTSNVEEIRRRNIARLRKELEFEPRNPVLLLDLARLRATCGERDKAERLARQALVLAPTSRWVLRSNAKLLTAHGKPDEAHRMLVRAASATGDPWLIAAELATAQASGRSPKFWRQAQLFLDAKSLQPIHLSELASAVGTLDALDGKVKRAKERFRQSLKEPTENALAQIKWAESKLRNGFQIQDLISSNRFAYEAAFRTAYQDQDMETALKLAKQWALDEPFAPEPFANQTYVASLLDDYETAIASGEREQQLAVARDHTIKNNRIFSLLSSGQGFDLAGPTKEIHEWIMTTGRDLREEKIEDAGDQVHTMANLGLYLYRAGDSEKGRLFYEKAAEIATSPRGKHSSAQVLTYHAREAILAGAPWAEVILEQARTAIRNHRHSGIAFYFAKVESLAANPLKWAEILSPASASQFKIVRPRVAPVHRVERTETGLILWVPRGRS